MAWRTIVLITPELSRVASLAALIEVRMVRECSEVASNISVVSTETIEYIMIIIGM
jgi:hypothetical protein